MKRIGLVAALIALLTAGLTSVAMAAPPHTGCPVGPAESGPSTIGSWELWEEEDFAEVFGEAGAAAFAFNNRNGDQYLCVMTQVLPNDASGSTTWYVFRDNNANAR